MIIVAPSLSFLNELKSLCLVLFHEEKHKNKNKKSNFSHPFLGTYEVHQFLDLEYLEGTHSGVVYELHTYTMVPWNGKPIPYPTHTNTMSPCTIQFEVIPYHQGCLGSFLPNMKSISDFPQCCVFCLLNFFQ